MTREQLIECMARAAFLDKHPGEDWSEIGPMTRNLYIRNQAAVLDCALTAAGMVVVPRAELEWVQQRCNEASPSYSERDILHDIHARIRAMMGAANG